jgi:hypothetical protein
MSHDDVGRRLKTMAENVLTLEVNTIVCAHVEAEKMPTPEHALIDIANEYRSWMQDEHGQEHMWKDEDASTASRAVFQQIRAAAAAVLETKKEEGTSERNLLERIKANSDQLAAMFERLDATAGRPVTLLRTEGKSPPEVELLPEDIMVLRKAWELMLDEVLMQTTIQIDGDVVTRIRRGLGADGDGATVMKLHQKAVSTSTAFWEQLVAIMGGALKGLLEVLVGK